MFKYEIRRVRYATYVFFSLCSPVLAPQIVGGEGPDGFVTLKESTRHWPPFERLIVPSWVNIY